MKDRLSQTVVAAALCVLAIAAYTSLHGSSTAQVAQASSAPSTKGMQVSGSGAVTLRPDQARIRFMINGRGTSLAAAENQASKAMRHVISAMQAGGVDKSDLRTGAAQAYKPDAHTATYVARQQLTVTVRDPSRAGGLVSKGVDAGAHATVGPTFSIGDRQKAYNDALAAAVSQARAKADAIAKAAGVRVTGVVSVNEQQGSPYYGAVRGFASDQLAALPIPTRRGTREVDAQVQVVFAYG